MQNGTGNFVLIYITYSGVYAIVHKSAIKLLHPGEKISPSSYNGLLQNLG